MSKRTVIGISILIGVFSLGALGQVTASVNKNETAVRGVVQAVQDGWNAHDAKAFAAAFAEEADYVVVNGMHAKGRKEIEEGHVGIFSTIYKESKNTATIKRVRFLRPDQAVVHVEWNLEFTLGGTLNKGHAMNTMVIGKRPDGKWLIDVFQNTPIEPPRMGQGGPPKP